MSGPAALKVQFTIVTPSYRGASFLPGLHGNLRMLATVNPCFEWLIVDDFSNDGGATAEAIRECEAEQSFPVRSLFLNENYSGAKSVAAASEIAAGEYIIILDQDDRLTPDALAIFSRHIRRYSHRSNFAGVCGRCVNSQNRMIGKPIKGHEMYCTETMVRHKSRIRGEMFQCTRTDLIKKYFKEVQPGYTNGFVWARMAQDQYHFAYVNDIVRHYDTENPGSMTNLKKIKFVENAYFQSVFYLNNAIEYLQSDPLEILRFCIHCERYRIHARRASALSAPDAAGRLKVLMVFVHPLSRLLVLSDLIKGRVV